MVILYNTKIFTINDFLSLLEHKYDGHWRFTIAIAVIAFLLDGYYVRKNHFKKNQIFLSRKTQIVVQHAGHEAFPRWAENSPY